MQQRPHPAPTKTNPVSKVKRWEDFLTPEQRIKTIAEILATIALRIMKEKHETSHPNNL